MSRLSSRLSICWVGVAAAAVGLICSAAVAGPVSSAGGSAVIDFQTSGSLEFGSRTFEVTYPGSATHEYDGLIPDNVNSTVAGSGAVTYDLVDSNGGAAMDVSVAHRNRGDGFSNGGTASFALDFTTDRPLRYRYVANIPGLSLDFSSGLDSGGEHVVFAWGRIVQDVVNGPHLEGTVPHSSEEFSAFTQEGVLPAGQYRLFAVAESGVESRQQSPINSQGSLRLTLEAEGGPGPTPVPLPPGAWPALGTMALAGGAGLVRRGLRRGFQGPR